MKPTEINLSRNKQAKINKVIESTVEGVGKSFALSQPTLNRVNTATEIIKDLHYDRNKLNTDIPTSLKDVGEIMQRIHPI